MPLYFETSHPSLQQYVNAYIIYDQAEPTPSQNVVPIGSQFLWVFIKGDAVLQKNDRSQLKVPPVAMLGFWTQTFRTIQTFPAKVVAVNFRPYAAHALFGLNMIAYQNNVYDFLDGKFPVNNLLNNLKRAESTVDIKAILDEWLLHLLSQNNIDISLIQNITNKIEERHGNIHVEEILSSFYLTERTLQRLFDKMIGVNPKLYIRLQRFNYVFSALENETMNLQEMIYEAGYFDQSHFIKDFVQFTQCNPSEFKKLEMNTMSRQTLAGILKSLV